MPREVDLHGGHASSMRGAFLDLRFRATAKSLGRSFWAQGRVQPVARVQPVVDERNLHPPQVDEGSVHRRQWVCGHALTGHIGRTERILPGLWTSGPGSPLMD